MKKLLLALLLCSAPALAQISGGSGVTEVYGTLVDTSTTASIGAGVVVPYDTQVAGNVGGNICDVTTHKGRCTPTLAGTYGVTCKVDASGTTGPVVGSPLLAVSIEKNGVDSTNGDNGVSLAQVAAIASPRSYVASYNLVTMNGTTDYWECFTSSNGTGFSVNNTPSRVGMVYQYIGP